MLILSRREKANDGSLDPIEFTGSDGNGHPRHLKIWQDHHHFTHHTASKHRAIAKVADSSSVAISDFDRYIMPKYVYSVATSAHLSFTH